MQLPLCLTAIFLNISGTAGPLPSLINFADHLSKLAGPLNRIRRQPLEKHFFKSLKSKTNCCFCTLLFSIATCDNIRSLVSVTSYKSDNILHQCRSSAGEINKMGNLRRKYNVILQRVSVTNVATKTQELFPFALFFTSTQLSTEQNHSSFPR